MSPDSSAIRALPPRETAVTACARALRESVLSGRLPAGSRLPPERELAATLGVNRLTLRNALAQIVAAGLVSVRQGSGYVVRDFAEDGGPDLLAPLFEVLATPSRRRETIADLLLVRRAVGRAALERLMEKITPDGIRRIAAAVDGLAAAVAAPGASPATIAAADRATIRAILRETGSTVLTLVGNPVFRVADAVPDLTRAMYAEPAMNIAGLRMLVQALETRDAAAIEPLMKLLAAADEAVVERMAGGAKRPSAAAPRERAPAAKPPSAKKKRKKTP